MTVEVAFANVQRVFLDSAPVIYAVEQDPTYSARTWRALNHCVRNGEKTMANRCRKVRETRALAEMVSANLESWHASAFLFSCADAHVEITTLHTTSICHKLNFTAYSLGTLGS